MINLNSCRKDAVIVRDSNDTPYFYIVKSVRLRIFQITREKIQLDTLSAHCMAKSVTIATFNSFSTGEV